MTVGAVDIKEYNEIFYANKFENNWNGQVPRKLLM